MKPAIVASESVDLRRGVDHIGVTGWFTSDHLPDPLHSQFYNSFNPAKELGIVR